MTRLELDELRLVLKQVLEGKTEFVIANLRAMIAAAERDHAKEDAHYDEECLNRVA